MRSAYSSPVEKGNRGGARELPAYQLLEQQVKADRDALRAEQGWSESYTITGKHAFMAQRQEAV